MRRATSNNNIGVPALNSEQFVTKRKKLKTTSNPRDQDSEWLNLATPRDHDAG